MLETEDCTPKFKTLPDSDDYLLEAVSISDKIQAGEGYQREWKLNVTSDKQGILNKDFVKRFFASQIKELLIGFGGEVDAKDPNKINIDYATVPGKCVRCTITSTKVTSKKDDKKEFTNYKFSNVEPEIPF